VKRVSQSPGREDTGKPAKVLPFKKNPED